MILIEESKTPPTSSSSSSSEDDQNDLPAVKVSSIEDSEEDVILSKTEYHSKHPSDLDDKVEIEEDRSLSKVDNESEKSSESEDERKKRKKKKSASAKRKRLTSSFDDDDVVEEPKGKSSASPPRIMEILSSDEEKEKSKKRKRENLTPSKALSKYDEKATIPPYLQPSLPRAPVKTYDKRGKGNLDFRLKSASTPSVFSKHKKSHHTVVEDDVEDFDDNVCCFSNSQIPFFIRYFFFK